MELVDPVAVHRPQTFAEGKEVARRLTESGIPAQVIMEEVVVARADLERATEALQALSPVPPSNTPSPSGPAFVNAVCEECGQSSLFDGALANSVQECPHCGKFMDVAVAGEDLDWGEAEDDE